MEQVRSFRFFLMVTLLASVWMTDVARADSDAGYRNYVRLNIGVNQPTGDLDDAGYDAGIHGGPTYGRYLGKYVVAEGALRFFTSDQDFSGTNAVAGNFTREDWIWVSSVLLTLKGEIPLGPVTLFAGGGGGVYFVNLNSEIESNIGSFDTDDDDVVFGSHIVAGGYYNITKRFFAGAEAMYRWTGSVGMQKNVATIPISVNGDLNGYTISLMGGFRF